MDTKYYDLPLGDICDAAHFEQYLDELLTRVDATMHDIDLRCSVEDADALTKELTCLKCNIIAIAADVRAYGFIVRSDHKSVGDMLLEIKTFEAKLADIQNQVDAHEVKLEEHERRLDGTEVTIKALEARANLQDTRDNQQKERIDELDKQVDELGNKVDTHGAWIDEHEQWSQNMEKWKDEHVTWANKLDETVHNLADKSFVQEGIIQHDKKRMDALDQWKETHEEWSSNLADRVTSAEQNIAEEVVELGEIKGWKTATENRVTAAENKVDGLAAKLSENEVKDAILKAQVEVDEQAISDIQAEQVEQNRRLDQAETDIDALEGRMETAEGEIHQNKDDISQLKVEHESMQETLEQHREQLDAFNSTVTSAVTSASLAAERANEAADRAGASSSEASTAAELAKTAAKSAENAAATAGLVAEQFDDLKEQVANDENAHKAEVQGMIDEFKETINNQESEYETSLAAKLEEHKNEVTESENVHKQEVQDILDGFEQGQTEYQTNLTQQFTEFKESTASDVDSKLAAQKTELQTADTTLENKLTPLITAADVAAKKSRLVVVSGKYHLFHLDAEHATPITSTSFTNIDSAATNYYEFYSTTVIPACSFQFITWLHVGMDLFFAMFFGPHFYVGGENETGNPIELHIMFFGQVGLLINISSVDLPANTRIKSSRSITNNGKLFHDSIVLDPEFNSMPLCANYSPD